MFTRASLVLIGLAACGGRTGLLVEGPTESTAHASESSTQSLSAFTSNATSNFTSTPSSVVVVSATSSGVISFASGPDWASYVGVVLGPNQLSPKLGASLGAARDVCVTAQNPPNCPSGALIYGSPSTPWRGSRSLPNVPWIWRGDVATNQPGDFQAAVFERSFTVGAKPSGAIQVTVDDLAQVFVNGVLAGTTGSVTSFADAVIGENMAVRFDLSRLLQEGTNVIDVAVQNGPPSFGTGCGSQGCTYSQNPAGVAFSGQLRW